MQTVASKSPLGWAVVHKIEGTKDFDKEIIDLDGEEVRKVEKDLVAYNSECTVSNLFLLDFLWLLCALLSFHFFLVPSRGHCLGDQGLREQRRGEGPERRRQEEEVGGPAAARQRHLRHPRQRLGPVQKVGFYTLGRCTNLALKQPCR